MLKSYKTNLANQRNNELNYIFYNIQSRSSDLTTIMRINVKKATAAINFNMAGNHGIMQSSLNLKKFGEHCYLNSTVAPVASDVASDLLFTFCGCFKQKI